MNKEIKEIKHRLQLLHAECNPKAREEDINWVINYITNLQQEINKLTAESTEWESKYYEMQDNFHNTNEEIERQSKAQVILDNMLADYKQENERLKKELNCKEYFSSTMPEDTEFVILTKANYDRQQKDIQLELIDYKSRCEKAIEYIEKHFEDDEGIICKITGEMKREINYNFLEHLLNILQNGSEDNG